MDDEIAADLAGMRAAQDALVARTEDITDAEARAPSRLPGWSVGHVLTHIARNGDSVARRLEGVARGEIVDQYPGGYEGRAADIERGRTGPRPSSSPTSSPPTNASTPRSACSAAMPGTASAATSGAT